MKTVTFIPQAWIRDYAVEVDPEGPTTFEVPDESLAGIAPNSYESDELRYHPNAPGWVKNWHGPFAIVWED